MPVLTATTIDEAADALQGAPSPIVVLPIYNSYGDVVQCLEAFTAHTPATIALLVVDDAGVDQRAVQLLDRLGGRLAHTVVVLHHEQNQGYVRSCNDAFAATAGRDVVLLNSDVIVGPEWLERLSDAARSSDAVATASTLTNYGTVLSVPHRNVPTSGLPGGMTPDEAARRVAAGSLKLRPQIPTAIGHCTYVRRAALDLVGTFDETFSPGYGEEVDFCQRALMHGFRHVCADDVFTYHRGSASFSKTTATTRQTAHDAIVRQRYPWYDPWVRRAATDTGSPLALALGAARRSLVGMCVGVDARCLGPHRMGTQQVVIETVRALAARSEIAEVVLFAPRRLPDYARHLTDLAKVTHVDADAVLADADEEDREKVDLVYRPYQITSMRDLVFLDRVAQRYVINQLDTIAYENPSYFDSDHAWLAYRDLTSLTFERAAGVAMLSEHSRRSAAAAGLLRPGLPERVVYCGVDAPDAQDGETPPAGLGEADRGFLLCLGVSYHHKNRRLVLDIWAELRRRGSNRRIVLAGAQPPYGSSVADEAELLLEHPELRNDVVAVGAAGEAEKRWLYRHAGLVLYASTVEGFGLVPFEAAAYGVPTLSTRQGSLDEVLPAGLPVLDRFDPQAGADLAEKLLQEEAAAQVCAAIRAAGERFTWDRTAGELLALFNEAMRQPRPSVLAIEGEAGDHVGLPSRAQLDRSRRGKAGDLDRMISLVTRNHGLKRRLSPDGSLRQAAVRSVVHRARGFLERRSGA